MKNKEYVKKLDADFQNCKTKREFQDQVRKTNKLRSTKKLFGVLSNTSSHFNELKLKNNLGIEISDFYQVLAFVRHKVTHSGSKVKKSEIKKWPKKLELIFNEYFTIEESDHEFIITPSQLEAQRIINMTAEYGYLIYKSISLSNNYEHEI